METVVQLVRAVVRAFYTDEHAAAMEPLLREPYYLEDDETRKGALSRKLGWINSRKIRQLLDTLVEHSLVHKKEITVTIDLDMGVADGSRHKRDFYYVDFVHFVKIMTVRLHYQIANAITRTIRSAQLTEWLCEECEIIYHEHDVWKLRTNSDLRFTCPECGSVLEEKIPEVTPSSSFGQETYAKFQEQMSGESGQRDSVFTLLKQAQHTGSNLPDNDPAKKIKKIDMENRKRLQMDNDNLGDEESYLEIHGSKRTQEEKEMPDWFKFNQTGEMTEEAMVEENDKAVKKKRGLENEALKNAQTENYALQYEKEQREALERARKEAAEKEAAAASVSVDTAQETEAEPTFTFSDGRTIRLSDIDSEEKWEELLSTCPESDLEGLRTFAGL